MHVPGLIHRLKKRVVAKQLKYCGNDNNISEK
ncbi:hypothetical protein CDSM653_00823 [Caldanaerobacter subterraneus subsp. pacificus DSM 12653]|jgi:hypothetical protein|uniref:Uncharacterized protein n=1 Tax=Caldanaerobacter subterraneus subsp. pacificus DSM 12653 TaxID=391606 RepID=A0A0F5PP23_9THEO|nr:hypothetical protein CDSM653_00823 [Caldanaerobacter subterraneus subsp. pacificus DSM 12653]